MKTLICPCPHEGSREIKDGYCRGCGRGWARVDLDEVERLNRPNGIRPLYPSESGGPAAVNSGGQIWVFYYDFGGRWISEDNRVEEDIDVLRGSSDYFVIMTNTSHQD